MPLPRFTRRLELNPDHAEAHRNLYAALGKKGRPDDAIAEFYKAQRWN